MRELNMVAANAVNAAANVTSTTIPLKYIDTFSASVTINGNATGNVKLQVANAADGDLAGTGPISGVTWFDLDDSTRYISSSAPVLYYLQNNGFRFARVVYTVGAAGSGASTMNVRVNGKGGY